MDAGMVAILTTIIAEAAGIIGILLKNSSDRKKNAIEQAKRDQNIEDRLHQLEKKVDAHNGYAKIFAENSKIQSKTAETLAAIQKDIEWLKKK